MADAKSSRGMIAVDKMGTKVLFLNPVTYEMEVVLDDFPRTGHELLVVPDASVAYVPIFGVYLSEQRFKDEVYWSMSRGLYSLPRQS